jgi:streptogramin lyase
MVTLGNGLNMPMGVAVDSSGNVYVADTNNNAVKEIFTNGTIRTLGSGFAWPIGVAVDSSGNVYVTDPLHNTIKEILTNETMVTLDSGLEYPGGIAVDSLGDLFITNNNTISEFAPVSQATPYTTSTVNPGSPTLIPSINSTPTPMPSTSPTPAIPALIALLIIGILGNFIGYKK